MKGNPKYFRLNTPIGVPNLAISAFAWRLHHADWPALCAKPFSDSETDHTAMQSNVDRLCGFDGSRTLPANTRPVGSPWMDDCAGTPRRRMYRLLRSRGSCTHSLTWSSLWSQHSTLADWYTIFASVCTPEWLAVRWTIDRRVVTHTVYWSSPSRLSALWVDVSRYIQNRSVGSNLLGVNRPLQVVNCRKRWPKNRFISPFLSFSPRNFSQ